MVLERFHDLLKGRYMLIFPSYALHPQFHDIVFYKKRDLILGEHRDSARLGSSQGSDCRPRSPAFIATGMTNASSCPPYVEEGLLTLELHLSALLRSQSMRSLN